MNAPSPQLELTCPSCSHVEPCGPLLMLERLQQLGMLKRASNPEPELLLELFTNVVERLACRSCQHVGLALQMVDEQDWHIDRQCETCGQPISRERLDVLPDTTHCARCARAPAQTTEDVEYCPKCGAAMSIRPRHGSGVTRYQLTCPACR